jgi:hypothetical protein
VREDDRKKLILTRMLSETREENALARGHVTKQSLSTQLVPPTLHHKDYQGSLELRNWVRDINWSVLLHAMSPRGEKAIQD